MATFADFQKLDIRVGRVISCKRLADGKYSTHKLRIDFGPEIGEKISCARLVRYQPQKLEGKLVLGVVNFPPKQIGKTISEVLTLGVPDKEGECVLVIPEFADVNLGGKLH